MEQEEEKGVVLAQNLIDTVNSLASYSNYKCVINKDYCNLARRLKLLIPMFEEIRDSQIQIREDGFSAMVALKHALDSSADSLRLGCEGSRIYLVLERDHVMSKLYEVTSNVEQALSRISYEALDISDEVKEQVDLVLAQFKRAKERTDAPDVELYEDLLSLYNKSGDVSAEPASLRRISEKLHLMGVAELTHESQALLDMVAGGDPGQTIEKMSMILKKIKDSIQTENLNLSSPTSSGIGQALFEGNHSRHVIPDDFRCPISLDLMKDPVIVSTGQTYERACIEKWLEEGHVTCPKTQQSFTNTTLTPNYVLRSLIGQWCEGNGIETPKRPSVSEPAKTKSAFSAVQRTKIKNLLQRLTSSSSEDQLSAVGEIRLLAKRNSANRVAIAETGAIPLLVGLLSTPDTRIQEHAVTSLLNLSIREDNKASIIACGAVPGIIHVLKKGTMEARENAAATLFSLSVSDGYKSKIGSSGAIPPLVTLLREGTQRGKKDAATALFNLCIYQGNKGKAVRAGLVPLLMGLLTEPRGVMVDEALTILALLVSHSDGKTAIGNAGAVPVLVEIIGTGSPRNRENAASVLVNLFSLDQYVIEVQNFEVMRPLIDLTLNGTERGKLKALHLIERINRFFEQQNLAQAKDEDHAQQSEPPSEESAVSN